MNRNNAKKIRPPNPIEKASFLSKFAYWWVIRLRSSGFAPKLMLITKLFVFGVHRWLNPTFKIGLKRSLHEDDIYRVTEHMESAKNTETYTKLWNEELQKQNPSILRVIFKLHLHKLMFFASLFALFETIVRYVCNEYLCRAYFWTKLKTGTWNS